MDGSDHPKGGVLLDILLGIVDAFRADQDHVLPRRYDTCVVDSESSQVRNGSDNCVNQTATFALAMQQGFAIDQKQNETTCPSSTPFGYPFS